jgi:hypothetical protein
MAKKETRITPRTMYGFATMDAGETRKFPLPEDPEEAKHAATKTLCAAYQAGRRAGTKFRGQTKEYRGKRYIFIERYV